MPYFQYIKCQNNETIFDAHEVFAPRVVIGHQECECQSEKRPCSSPPAYGRHPLDILVFGLHKPCPLHGQIRCCNRKMTNLKILATYEKFQDELSDLINTHNNNTKTTKVGDYQIIVQTDCSFDMDIKPPVLTPFEKDCYSAKAAADASAEMIINTAPNNPPSIEFVQSAVTDCKMTLSVSKSFTIHNLCYVEEFAAEYKAILDDYQSKLHAAGFTTRKDNDDGSTTFSSDTVHKSIDLEKHLGQNIDPETFNISAVPELS